jgi:serine/threonine protein phosphatase PrpC
MRALGVWDETEVDIASLEIQTGDTFLLCSDGLYGMLPDEDLKALADRAPDSHTGVAWMIDAANQAGGSDNITAMVVQVHESASESPPPDDAEQVD